MATRLRKRIDFNLLLCGAPSLGGAVPCHAARDTTRERSICALIIDQTRVSA
jgi:hypothetical protein